ncbi:helix-turn-helix transcriptional regulator [Bacteroides graminisolvens]|uniref:helix-turn-helix domain-containing protein n=1 Tax=Bacteroides graminisolvens TaxID=477666 RepID=UPI0029C6F69F|nr:helix-turn-helix transcriptional regulator [Bacteroides graminisolvens]
MDLIISMRDEREYAKVKSRMKLAVKIADALKERNMSQKELAEKLGKKPSEVSKWLSGTHNFTHDTLVDVEFVLGIELFSIKDGVKREIDSNISGSKLN